MGRVRRVRRETTREQDKDKDKKHAQLALHQQRPCSHHLADRRVLDHEHKVAPVLAGHPVVALHKRGLADVAHRRQHPQAVEEAGGIVGAAQGAHAVARRQHRSHLGADKLVREEFGHCVGLRGGEKSGREMEMELEMEMEDREFGRVRSKRSARGYEVG